MAAYHPRPGYRYPARDSSEAALRRPASDPSILALHEAGWLRISQSNKFGPIRFTLRNPVAERRQAGVEAARRRVEEAPFRGEALMREYLSLIVASDEFEDNATPGFLVNPFTGEEMQFDRYYPPRAQTC